MLGQLLDGRYQVIRVLGSGGFGQTYIAQDTKLPGNPVCVVKQLKPTSSGPKLLETIRRLFQREAEILAKLSQYDQIPRLLAYNEEEFYLVQEFIDGHPLKNELLPGECWNENQTIEMLQEILGILEIVHSYGVIHRDIKPDNIIRRASDNKLVLIDFGAIKQVRTQVIAEQEQVSATIAIGTPGYMPTEQGLGKPRPNSDIYSLGIIGIQAVTGLYPYQFQEDLSTGEIIWQHQAQVNPRFAEVLTTMVRYHFKDRYQSATEALQALQELINPTYVPSAQAIVASIGWMHELTLEWMEAGQLKTYTINNKQSTKHPGTIRIGRDPQVCDIVLSELTVSGLHAEIFYNLQQQSFYVRSLRQSNPPVIDGQPLLTGEVALSEGSHLQLGHLNLNVSAIVLKHYPVGYNSIKQITPPQTIIPEQSEPAIQNPPLQTIIPEQSEPAIQHPPLQTIIPEASVAKTPEQSLPPTPLEQQPAATFLQSPPDTVIQVAAATSIQSSLPATTEQQSAPETSLPLSLPAASEQPAPETSLPSSLAATSEQQPAAATSLQLWLEAASEQQPATETSLQAPPTAIKEQSAAKTQHSLPSYSAQNRTPRSSRSSPRRVRRPASSPPIIRPATTSSNKLPRLVGVSIMAIVGGVGGLAFLTNSRVQTKSNASSIAIDNATPPAARSQKPQAKSDCFAVVEGNVRSKPTIDPNNIIEFSLGEKLAVTGKQTQKGWLEVKRSNGDLAWVYQDVISNQQEMNSCLKTKGLSVQTVEDIPNPQDSLPPPIIDADSPANSFSLPSPTIEPNSPANSFSSPPPILKFDTPANSFSSPSPTNPIFSPTIDPSNPSTDSSNSSSQPNPSKPSTDSSNSSSQPNPSKPSTDSSNSSSQPNPSKPSTDGSNSSAQPTQSNPSTNSSNSSAQPIPSVQPTNDAKPIKFSQPVSDSSSSIQINNPNQSTNDLTSSPLLRLNLEKPSIGLNSSSLLNNPSQAANSSNSSLNSGEKSNIDTKSQLDSLFLSNPHTVEEKLLWNIAAPERL